MSKPNKDNRIFCPQSGKFKLQFESENKANLFIKYNLETFESEKKPCRVYYCDSCCCYHITSKEKPKQVKENQYRDDFHIENVAKKFGFNQASKKEIKKINKLFNIE